MTSPDPLPADLAAAHAMILAERAARCLAETRAQNAEAEVSGARLEIELSRGGWVRISGSVDPAVVTAALRVLVRR